MVRRKTKTFILSKKFIKNVLFTGNVTVIEILLKILFKKLLKTVQKSCVSLFKLFVNYLSYLIKFNDKIKRQVSYKSLFSLKSKFSFSLKLVINKLLFYNKSNMIENVNNLLITKKQPFIKLFNYKKLLLHYRW